MVKALMFMASGLFLGKEKALMIRFYIGIDPGQRGGFARIKSDESNAYEAVKMPSTERDIWDLVSRWREDSFAIIEKVHSMPGQGVASTFKFGKGYGGLRMALIAAQIPFIEVTPRKWQAALGVAVKRENESKTDFKNRLKGMAQQMFPLLKMTLAIADSLLIAEYAQQLKSGGRNG